MSFITSVQERKFNQILEDYQNGNLEKASQAIKFLNKKDLVALLLDNHQIERGFLAGSADNYYFQVFVEESL